MECCAFQFSIVARAIIVALSLGLISPALAQSQSAALSPVSYQSSDEDTVRSLTEKYGLAIAAGELETMRRLWNPESPNLASRLRSYQGLFSNVRVEFISVKVTKLEIAGGKAVSHLTTDDRLLDRKTGGILSEREVFHGSCRAFEWIKRGDAWKIEREFSVQEELAAR